MPWDFDFQYNEPEPVETPPTEMLRYNTGKPRISLVPTAFLLAIPNQADLIYEVAKVMDYGATKYAMNNWRKAGPWLKVLDSGLRHLYKMRYDKEKVDEESGIHHAGHLGCNIAFLMEFVREGDGVDDRFKTKARVGFQSDRGDLEKVLDHLIDWRDGGSHDNLEQAAIALAMWYETETKE